MQPPAASSMGSPGVNPAEGENVIFFRYPHLLTHAATPWPTARIITHRGRTPSTKNVDVDPLLPPAPPNGDLLLPPAPPEQ